MVHGQEPGHEWVSCLGAGGAAGWERCETLSLSLGQQQGEVSKGQRWLSTAMEHRGNLGGGEKTGQGGTCHVLLAGGGWELIEGPLPLQDTSKDLALCSQHCGPAGLEQPV